MNQATSEAGPPANGAAGATSLGARLVTLFGVLLPPLGVAAAALSVWGWGVDWVGLGLLAGMYLLTGLGVTVGFHRLFTHRSFETSRVVQVILAVCGSMAVEGPLLTWVATHRRHHQHSDEDGDPHSPHLHGRGVLGVLRGLWHAHLGWILWRVPTDVPRYVPDLRRSALLRWVSALFPLWVVVGLLIPTALGGLFGGGSGALLGLIWGGLVRVFLIHHVTWSVNSVCHLWGGRSFPSPDQSRNNFVFGILALGEGWHNNHHAFPTSARHGLRWWQIDISYQVIWAMARVGLAWQLKQPTPV